MFLLGSEEIFSCFSFNVDVKWCARGVYVLLSSHDLYLVSVNFIY